MTICIDARMLRASGIGTYLQNLLPSLSQIYDLILIGNPDDLSAYQATKIETSIPIYSMSEIIKFSSLVPACDVFWSPHYNVPLLPIKAKKKLVTIHDVFHLAYFNTLSLKQKVYAKIEMQAAVTKSNRIITVSSFSKEEIVKYTNVSSEKISVIYNGVDHHSFRPVSDVQQLNIVRQKYNLPKQFLLFVGNVKPHKNLITLVKAFGLLRDEFPDLALVVVGKKEGFITGDRSLFDFLHQDEELNKRVVFTGFVADEDLPVVYNLADLFVFPSLYEGFGLPPLEAMACGCPVLVSDRASMPEVCEGEALYADPEDAAQMARQIHQTLTMPDTQRQLMIARGIQQSKRYLWQKTVEQHINLLHNLLP